MKKQILQLMHVIVAGDTEDVQYRLYSSIVSYIIHTCTILSTSYQIIVDYSEVCDTCITADGPW